MFVYQVELAKAVQKEGVGVEGRGEGGDEAEV